MLDSFKNINTTPATLSEVLGRVVPPYPAKGEAVMTNPTIYLCKPEQKEALRAYFDSDELLSTCDFGMYKDPSLS